MRGELLWLKPCANWWSRCRWKRQFLAQYAHHQSADTEAESTFRLAGAGVQNYEKTIAGTEAKLSMLGQKLTQQQRAVEQYRRALVAANDKLKAGETSKEDDDRWRYHYKSVFFCVPFSVSLPHNHRDGEGVTFIRKTKSFLYQNHFGEE